MNRLKEVFIKNKIKIVIIAVVVLAVAIGSFFYFQWIKKVSQENNEMVIEQGDPLNITKAEIEKVSGKTYKQVVSDFNADKESCLDLFKTVKMEDLLASDRLQATSFISCEAVKTGNASECNLLKSDEGAFGTCQDMANTYLNFVYPVFEKKDCLMSFSSADDKNACSGFIFNREEDCRKITNSLTEKSICLAVAQDKISACDQLQDKKEAEGCQNFYYFAKAVKENNLSYIDNITSGAGTALARLFFDRNLSCADLLTASNKKYCDTVFSDQAFKRRIGVWNKFGKK